MYQYRHILFRMRSGDSDRDLTRDGLVGRRKAGELRRLATSRGWLDSGRALPDEAELAATLAAGPKHTTPSLVEPFRDKVEAWAAEGIDGSTGPWSATVVLPAVIPPFGASSSRCPIRMASRPRCCSISRRERPPRWTSAPVPP